MTAVHEGGNRVDLVAIEGEQLSAVTFVQDYLQLHFDGPRLTLITLPFVMKGETRFDPGSAGYRDALCSFIAQKVLRAYAIPADRLQIEFSDQTSIITSLKPESYRAAHAVFFDNGPDESWAW
jgi:L-fucose isomerase-like protein